jgi:hypothetical protein
VVYPSNHTAASNEESDQCNVFTRPTFFPFQRKVDELLKRASAEFAPPQLLEPHRRRVVCITRYCFSEVSNLFILSKSEAVRYLNLEAEGFEACQSDTL